MVEPEPDRVEPVPTEADFRNPFHPAYRGPAYTVPEWFAAREEDARPAPRPFRRTLPNVDQVPPEDRVLPGSGNNPLGRN